MARQSRRVAIVTGGARGIGRACALALARRGLDVVLVDLLEEEMAQTAIALRAAGARTHAYTADVADFARAGEVVEDVLGRFARLDVLVNNAGRPCPEGLLEITEAEWDRTIDVNLKSCFNWCRAAAPAMLAQGAGRIVNMSSVSAHTGGVTSAVSKFAYAAAKAGILGLTRGLAKELGPAVAVNAVCPGFVKTELTAQMLSARQIELTRGVALGRFGEPADIAEVVAFLATAEPCYLSGEAITVDGGQWIL
ncbi:MAG: SDR family NAD(P)-dependent oxidoreductase [Gammaproteobacteria bacterium]|nr:SDR family NAD(P)-dependent oxidoreductase [Gammaproteobacteria bacterium]